jgi:hypothetical protein
MTEGELLKALKKKLHLTYEGAIKAADNQVTLRYEDKKDRISKVGNEFHVGYRMGRFEENVRLKKYHDALLRFVSRMESLRKPSGQIEAGINSLLEEIR